MKETEFLKAFITVGYYNGYEDKIIEIYDYIKGIKCDNRTSIAFPSNILSYDSDMYDRVLWSTLVIMFGDYGISPRTAWIEKKEECLKFLEYVIKEISE